MIQDADLSNYCYKLYVYSAIVYFLLVLGIFAENIHFSELLMSYYPSLKQAQKKI